MKRFITGLLLLSLTLSIFGGCGFESGQNPDSESASVKESTGDSSASAEGKILEAQQQKTLAANESVTYTIDADLGNKNYVSLQYESDVHLYGEFVYVNVQTGDSATEVFFLEKEETEFKQFLDAFRPNGIGCFEKILQSVTFTNKSEASGKFALQGMYVSERSIPETEREIYILKDGLKVGADLAAGGALTYLGREYYETKDGNRETVDEVIDNDNNVYIGVGISEDACKSHLSSSVNLINAYDLGREFQQSYYAAIGGSEDNPNGANGYTRGFCDTTGKGYYWLYNPVQVGDCAYNPSQIIDYECTEDSIWVKIRPMDWSKGDTGKGYPNTFVGGETTKSYMENTYTVKDGVLYVVNSFIDWNGFYDLESTVLTSNELPAAYIVHPLRNYVCYTGDKPWTNDTLDVQGDLKYWSEFRNDFVHPEDWFAWVNNEMFGVGVYVPNMEQFTSGSLYSSSSITQNGNRGAFNSPYVDKLLYNKEYPSSTYTSCYVTNTNYTAPTHHWRLKEYEKRSYGYAISVDYVDVMRNQFKEIYTSGTLTNASMNTWCL